MGTMSISDGEVSVLAQSPLALTSALRTRVCADVIAHIMHEAAFNILRTQQQLGYNVDVSVHHDIEFNSQSSDNVTSFCISVQSGTHSASVVDERISAFIVTFRSELLAMASVQASAELDSLASAGVTEMDCSLDALGDVHPPDLSPFLRSVSSLIAQKAQPPSSLLNEAERSWSQIRRGTYMFAPERAQAETTALRALSLRTVLQLFDETFGVREVAVGRDNPVLSESQALTSAERNSLMFYQDDALTRKMSIRVLGRGAGAVEMGRCS
jgi:secreted Zn-dependent insulinase-like peptidase